MIRQRVQPLQMTKNISVSVKINLGVRQRAGWKLGEDEGKGVTRNSHSGSRNNVGIMRKKFLIRK